MCWIDFLEMTQTLLKENTFWFILIGSKWLIYLGCKYVSSTSTNPNIYKRALYSMYVYHALVNYKNRDSTKLNIWIIEIGSMEA